MEAEANFNLSMRRVLYLIFVPTSLLTLTYVLAGHLLQDTIPSLLLFFLLAMFMLFPIQVFVVFWYPEGSGGVEPYPLVVFSHGGLGTENSNESLYRELASHGYIVCAIGHPYHAFWTKSEDGRTTFVSREYFAELQQEDAGRDKEQSFRYYQRWMEIRTADINFIFEKPC